MDRGGVSEEVIFKLRLEGKKESGTNKRALIRGHAKTSTLRRGSGRVTERASRWKGRMRMGREG